MRRRRLIPFLTAAVGLILFCLHSVPVPAAEKDQDRIRPYVANSYYWQFKGKPVLLLGGTKDDNLFQLPDLREHLDALHQAGGNYIRNTMSDRPNKGFEVYPFKKLPNGKYDLSRWNEEYWNRFEKMLRLTAEREIIVQIELWDRFDFSDHRSKNWSLHPYNPKNNVNYTSAKSRLKTTYRKHPGANEQPFFYTVPALRNNTAVLDRQRAQVDKMLSISLPWPHVLYCMDNETGGAPEWGAYWSRHIKQRAAEAGVEVNTTEMWDSWNLNHPHHRETFEHPELYSFVDISQNNHQKGQRHWNNAQKQRARIAKQPRPINNVKIYGADGARFGNQRDALERFWRNIIGGAASARFHRPDAGIGLSRTAQAHLKSARLLCSELNIFDCRPNAQSTHLSNRSDNEAYLTHIPGRQYAVYFPKGGSVELDLSKVTGTLSLKWLQIARSRWHSSTTVTGGDKVKLKAPDSGHWVALVSKKIGKQP